MKTYSIGREFNCDIVINDQTDVISRRHAILNVTSLGDMTITDMSSNGTYVNGIRISSNTPVPVTRKDNISFAHIARLDWSLIPDTRKKILWYAIGSIAALILLIAGIWGLVKLLNKPSSPTGEAPTPVPAVVDSISTNQAEEQQKREEQRLDSIKKHIQDSLEKERKKQPANPAPAQPRKKNETKKPGNSGNNNPPQKQEPKKEDHGSATRFH